MFKIRLLLLKATALLTILSVSFVSTILLHLASRTADFHNLRHNLLGHHAPLKRSSGGDPKASSSSPTDTTANIVKTARELAARSKQPFILVLHASIGMLSQIKSWLCNTATLRDVHDNTLIITDALGYAELSAFISSAGFAVTLVEDSLPPYLQSNVGYPFQTLGYWRTTQNRVRVLSTIVNGGTSFMNIEPDAVWAKSIYDQEELVGDDMGDDLVGIAGGLLARKTMCFGFLRLKNSTSVQRLMKTIVERVDEELGTMDEKEDTMKMMNQKTIRGEQHYLNRLLREQEEGAAALTGSIRKQPLRSRMLEKCAYPTGLWYDGGIFGDGADFRQRCNKSGTDVVVLQNNVARGNACKIMRLKRWEHWFVDESEEKCLDFSLEKARNILREGTPPNGPPTEMESNGQCSGYKQSAPKINIWKDKQVTMNDMRQYGPPPKGRFPDGGTTDFDEHCPWTSTHLLPTDSVLPKCTIFLRPVPSENEGIALWVSQMAMGYMVAVQAKCAFLFDYGEDVKINEIIRPVNKDLDWHVPDGFECRREENCFRLGRAGQAASYTFTDNIPGRDGSEMAPVPFYRFALWKGTHTPFYESSFRALEASISNMNIRRGFGCSLGKLFTLSPQASKYEPNLFTEILPTLRDESAAVVAIYVRSSETDLGADSTISEDNLRATTKGYTRRAQMLEQILLMNLGVNQHNRDIRSVIWLVVTDSVYLKGHIKSSFDGKDANALVTKAMQKFSGRVIPRRVIYTESRGLHSKAKHKGGTSVFAEAFIDWFLIGESDIVVTGPFTFGLTASLRTSRPVYDYNDGKELQLIRPGDPPAGGEVAKPGEAVKGQVVIIDGKPFNVDGCTLDNGMWLCTGKMGQDNSTKPK